MQTITMNDGYEIPQLGFGTFTMTSAEVDAALPKAIELGYRHIDTANAYFNEVAVGNAVRNSGIDREDFFITSKLFPQSYPYEQCGPDIDATLERLGLDYVDLMLFHQPYGAYVEGWKAMEEAVKAGKVRSVGLSNFPLHKVKEILDVATIKPAILQVEINPRWNQHELKSQLAGEGIAFEGWYPLGHGDKALLADPAFTEPAEKYGKSTAQVILRWHMQEGNIVFPGSRNPEHIASNKDIFDFELTDEEMARINDLPQKAYYTVPEEPPAFVLAHNDYSKQA
ncbi:MAG: aldo/keto reductase [Coriobacteriales bacterium]|jgi:2,5-diketo-D-gluconate reductase A